MQFGQPFKIKMYNPRLLLHSVQHAFLAWIGVTRQQLTLNDVAFSNVKTKRFIIGGVGVEDCDFNFETAANVTEQVINLGAIIPALARVLDVKTHTLEVFNARAIEIASWAVDTNVVTIVTDEAHGLANDNSVTIAGMAETALNGTATVTVVDATSFTFSKTHDNAETTAVTAGTVTATLTLAAETGNASSGNQFISSASIKALNAITAMANAGALNVAPSASASNVYVAATPSSHWQLVTSGKVAVYVTYIEAI